MDESPRALAALDAQVGTGDAAWWDRFYARRERPVPFFVAWPDESLVQWLQAGCIAPGPALDIGCGNGRNAVHLAKAGFAVEGVDLSAEALAWAARSAQSAGVPLTLHQASILEMPLAAGHYALVYDSGCFHHLPPHRRTGYVRQVAQALRPGGWFGLACFAPEGGSGLSDQEVYQHGTLGGGLGYSEAQLRGFWSPALDIHALRRMEPAGQAQGRFGLPFLWAMLARRAA